MCSSARNVPAGATKIAGSSTRVTVLRAIVVIFCTVRSGKIAAQIEWRDQTMDGCHMKTVIAGIMGLSLFLSINSTAALAASGAAVPMQSGAGVGINKDIDADADHMV